MISLGAIYLILAIGMSGKLPHTLPGSLSILSLGIAGALLFFVARYPAPVKPAPNAPYKTLWQVIKEKIAGAPPKPEEQVRQEEVAKAHGDMILSSTVCLIVSQTALIIALWRDPRQAWLARCTLILLPVLAVLFIGAFTSASYQGLHQRAAFILVLGWLLLLAKRFLRTA